MTRKTDALIRELASLFVRYGIADWTPLLDELDGARRGPALRAAIEELAAVAAKAHPAKARPKARLKKSTPAPPAHPERAPALADLRKAIASKAILPTTAEMRSVHTAFGIKQAPPKKREAIASSLLRHLGSVDDKAFESAMAILEREARGSPSSESADYKRWFDIIFGR